MSFLNPSTATAALHLDATTRQRFNQTALGQISDIALNLRPIEMSEEQKRRMKAARKAKLESGFSTADYEGYYSNIRPIVLKAADELGRKLGSDVQFNQNDGKFYLETQDGWSSNWMKVRTKEYKGSPTSFDPRWNVVVAYNKLASASRRYIKNGGTANQDLMNKAARSHYRGLLRRAADPDYVSKLSTKMSEALAKTQSRYQNTIDAMAALNPNGLRVERISRASLITGLQNAQGGGGGVRMQTESVGQNNQ